jgi:hypothetical protein
VGAKPDEGAPISKKERPSSYNSVCDAHGGSGRDFIMVFSGTLTIDLGYRAKHGQIKVLEIMVGDVKNLMRRSLANS